MPKRGINEERQAKIKRIRFLGGSTLPVHVDACLGEKSLYLKALEDVKGCGYEDVVQGAAVFVSQLPGTPGFVAAPMGGAERNQYLKEHKRDFRPLDDAEYERVKPLLCYIPVEAGSVVLWCSTLPHANCGIFKTDLPVATMVADGCTTGPRQVSVYTADCHAAIRAALTRDGVVVVRDCIAKTTVEELKAEYMQWARSCNPRPEKYPPPGSLGTGIVKCYGAAVCTASQRVRSLTCSIFRNLYGRHDVWTSVDAPAMVFSKEPGEFIRLCQFVCMLPRPDGDVMGVVQQKIRLFAEGKSSTHYPNFVKTAGPGHMSNPRSGERRWETSIDTCDYTTQLDLL